MNKDIIIVTGHAGLIGSQATRYFSEMGLSVVGIDNDMRKYFFGVEASTADVSNDLTSSYPSLKTHDCDIRDHEAIQKIFRNYGGSILGVIHCAAQPSHDWAAKEPLVDFDVNARATLNLLECVRTTCPEAVFILASTNKVYGDMPNGLEYLETRTRWEPANETLRDNGFSEELSIDQCLHSLFGASKLSADIITQEYGRYFGIKTGIFRGGCLTGPHHRGAELHGFLSYLVKCGLTRKKYTVYGYKGKQVRDNIHSFDLVSAFWEFIKKPRVGEVYNIGGGTFSNCSIIEAIELIQERTSIPVDYSISETNRIGDHKWWISDTTKFQLHYPQWGYQYSLSDMLNQMIEHAETTLE